MKSVSQFLALSVSSVPKPGAHFPWGRLVGGLVVGFSVIILAFVWGQSLLRRRA